MSGPSASVVASRVYASPRETVYRAFTEPRQIAKWLSPGPEVATSVEEFDLRPGGAYRLGFHFPEGRTDFVVGVYQEIRPAERLVYTWAWVEPDPHAGIETLVTVEFSDSNSGTRVVVRHDRFPTEERRSIHEQGWQVTLARLAEFIELTYQHN